jgi:DNA-binding NarL/FixJ family response regulator
MNTAEIIKFLKISENTLRTHRRHILSKNLCNFEQALYSFNLWNGSKQNT